MFSTTSFKVSLSWEFKNSSCSRLGMFDLKSENFPFNDYFGAFCVPLSAITVFKSSSSFFFSSIRSFIIYLSLASMNASLTMPPLDDGGLYYYIFFSKRYSCAYIIVGGWVSTQVFMVTSIGKAITFFLFFLILFLNSVIKKHTWYLFRAVINCNELNVAIIIDKIL